MEEFLTLSPISGANNFENRISLPCHNPNSSAAEFTETPGSYLSKLMDGGDMVSENVQLPNVQGNTHPGENERKALEMKPGPSGMNMNSEEQPVQMNWDAYMRSCQSKMAPACYFVSKNNTVDVPGLHPGMKLEAIDKNNPQSFCVATVVKVIGHRVRVRYDGYGRDNSNDIWCNFQAEELHPIGWCAQNGFPLQPPHCISCTLEEWRTFLTQTLTGALAAPRELFRKEHFQPRVHGFKVGMKLEVIHPAKPCVICPATVIKSLGPYYFLVATDYIQELPSVTFCCHSDSSGIFPPGWSFKNGVELTTPTNYTKKPFSWEKYMSYCRATYAPQVLFKKARSHKFRTGFKLEAVDLEQPNIIRIATVTNVMGRVLQLFFDGQSRFQFVETDSPDIYPIGWCKRTGHPLHTQFGKMTSKPFSKLEGSEFYESKLKLTSFADVINRKNQTSKNGDTTPPATSAPLLRLKPAPVVSSAVKPEEVKDDKNEKCQPLSPSDDEDDISDEEGNGTGSERFYHNKNQIHFNKSCCCGPLLNPEQVKLLPDATEPGKVSTVIRAGLEKVAKCAKDPGKVMDLMQEGSGVKVVLKHNGKIFKKAISRVDSRPKLERYLKRFCRRLICCEYFLSLTPVPSPCPDKCQADEHGNLQGPKGLKAKRSREYFETKHLGVEKKKRGRKSKSDLAASEIAAQRAAAGIVTTVFHKGDRVPLPNLDLPVTAIADHLRNTATKILNQSGGMSQPASDNLILPKPVLSSTTIITHTNPPIKITNNNVASAASMPTYGKPRLLPSPCLPTTSPTTSVTSSDVNPSNVTTPSSMPTNVNPSNVNPPNVNSPNVNKSNVPTMSVNPSNLNPPNVNPSKMNTMNIIPTSMNPTGVNSPDVQVVQSIKNSGHSRPVSASLPIPLRPRGQIVQQVSSVSRSQSGGPMNYAVNTSNKQPLLPQTANEKGNTVVSSNPKTPFRLAPAKFHAPPIPRSTTGPTQSSFAPRIVAVRQPLPRGMNYRFALPPRPKVTSSQANMVARHHQLPTSNTLSRTGPPPLIPASLAGIPGNGTVQSTSQVISMAKPKPQDGVEKKVVTAAPNVCVTERGTFVTTQMSKSAVHTSAVNSNANSVIGQSPDANALMNKMFSVVKNSSKQSKPPASRMNSGKQSSSVPSANSGKVQYSKARSQSPAGPSGQKVSISVGGGMGAVTTAVRSGLVTKEDYVTTNGSPKSILEKSITKGGGFTIKINDNNLERGAVDANSAANHGEVNEGGESDKTDFQTTSFNKRSMWLHRRRKKKKARFTYVKGKARKKKEEELLQAQMEHEMEIDSNNQEQNIWNGEHSMSTKISPNHQQLAELPKRGRSTGEEKEGKKRGRPPKRLYLDGELEDLKDPLFTPPHGVQISPKRYSRNTPSVTQSSVNQKYSNLISTSDYTQESLHPRAISTDPHSKVTPAGTAVALTACMTSPKAELMKGVPHAVQSSQHPSVKLRSPVEKKMHSVNSFASPCKRARLLSSYSPTSKKQRGLPTSPKSSRSLSEVSRYSYKRIPTFANIGTNTSLPGCSSDACIYHPSNPNVWTIEQVAEYVQATDCDKYATLFMDQEIDGESLLLLTRNALMQFTNMKLGPTLKMSNYIAQLRARAGDSDDKR